MEMLRMFSNVNVKLNPVKRDRPFQINTVKVYHMAFSKENTDQYHVGNRPGQNTDQRISLPSL